MEIQIDAFDAWVKYIFDHPVDDHLPQWYFQPDAPLWNETAEPATTVHYMTNLFENIAELCKPYSDAQLNQGFWFLVSNGGSSHMFTLMDKSVGRQERESCIRAMNNVFERLFAVRCSSHLSHTLTTYDPAMNPLNSVCYMWWDIIPIDGKPDDLSERWLNDTCLDVMQHSLNLPFLACQESALHGLGHWHYIYGERVQDIINSFLDANPDIHPQLKTYALSARGGCVL
jgi:hypothetical protein